MARVSAPENERRTGLFLEVLEQLRCKNMCNCRHPSSRQTMMDAYTAACTTGSRHASRVSLFLSMCNIGRCMAEAASRDT